MNLKYGQFSYLLPVIALSIMIVSSSFKPVQKGDVIITIEGVKSEKGELILALFNGKEEYLKKDYIHRKMKVNKTGTTTFVFEDVPVGEYSVSVIHDENENGKLDKNIVGVPKEGFGFSNVSMGLFGPPSYENTKFELKSDKVEVKVKLKHLYI